jgi:hypothetical protein
VTQSLLSHNSSTQTPTPDIETAPPRVLSFRHVKPFTRVSSPLVNTVAPVSTPVVEAALPCAPNMAPPPTPSSARGSYLSPPLARRRYEETISDQYSSVRNYPPPSRGNYPPSAPPSTSVRDYPAPSSTRHYPPPSVRDYPPVREYQSSSMKVHPPSSIRDYPSTAIRDHPLPAAGRNYPLSSARDYPPSFIMKTPPPPIRDYPPPLAQRQAIYPDPHNGPRTAPQTTVTRPQRRVSFSKEDEIATLPPDLPSHSSNQPDSISRGLSHLRLHPSNLSGMRSPHSDYEHDKHRNYEYVAKSDTSYIPEPKWTPLSESPARERPLAGDEDGEESYAHGPYRTENSPTPSMEVLVDNHDFISTKTSHEMRSEPTQDLHSRPQPQKARHKKGRDFKAGREEDRGWTKYVTVREYRDSQGPYVEVEEKIVFDDDDDDDDDGR